MATLAPNTYRLTQAWVEAAPLDAAGSPVAGGVRVLPVSDLTIDPVPYVRGGGSTAFTDVNGRRRYRCDGWHHDVTLGFDEVPDHLHARILDVLRTAHANSGVVRFRLAERAGAGHNVDASREVVAVLDAEAGSVPALFRKRVRERRVALRFRGETPLPTVLSWIED